MRGDRREANLDLLADRRGDALKHQQGMAFVFGVFKTADDGRGGTDAVGKASPAQSRSYRDCS